MTLSRHTQVENLSNLLSSRRRASLAEARRDAAYQRLVAAILDVTPDAVGGGVAPTTLERPMPSLLHQPQPRAA